MSRRMRKVRFTHRAESTVRRSEIMTLVIIIASAIVLFGIVSVIIGIALGNRSDKYQTVPKYDFSFEPYQSGDKAVKSVEAYAYMLGADVRGYIGKGITDLSFAIRDDAGRALFVSSVEAILGTVEEGAKCNLLEEMQYVHDLGGYACAYIYASSFACEDEYLREIYKAYEIAIIHEAAECGVDDILILGLDVTTENIAEVEKYVSDAAGAAGKAPLGVAVSSDLLLLTDQNVYFASRIGAVCDYLALDLRSMSPDADKIEKESEEDGSEAVSELDATLGELEYYIQAYKMRVIFSKENASLYDSATELGVSNIQIVD